MGENVPAFEDPDEAALWRRIAAHPFSRPDIALDFTGRLAAEMGWSRGEAERAIEEYRRFCFLAVSGEAQVTPSEEVDAVWHLHLTYSRDYWRVWCPQVLGTDLHHEPTAGGGAEAARFREHYARTLARYEARFGPPDPGFWPGTAERFGGRPRYRMIDSRRAIVVRRPRRLRPGRVAAGLLGVVLAVALLPVPAPAAVADSLDLPGPAFLALYARVAFAAAILSLILAFVLRRGLAGAGTAVDPESVRLDELELAYLAGGRRRAADAVALRLLTLGAASLDGAGRRITVGLEVPPPAEIAPYLPPGRGPVAHGTFVKGVSDRLGPLAQRLVRLGLLPDPAAEIRVALVSLVPVGAALLFGAAKVIVGIGRGKPVGFLLAMMAALTLAAILASLKRPRLRTASGERVLSAWRLRHARATRAPLPEEMPLAFALAGVAALAASADPVHAAYARYLRSPLSSDSGSGSGSGGGSDGGGGGSGCGGGGGCGGCGGGT